MSFRKTSQIFIINETVKSPSLDLLFAHTPPAHLLAISWLLTLVCVPKTVQERDRSRGRNVHRETACMSGTTRPSSLLASRYHWH
jgi:hypothetical protein